MMGLSSMCARRTVCSRAVQLIMCFDAFSVFWTFKHCLEINNPKFGNIWSLAWAYAWRYYYIIRRAHHRER